MHSNQGQNNLQASGSSNSSNNFCQLFIDQFGQGKQKHHDSIYQEDRYQYQPQQVKQKGYINGPLEIYNYFCPFILKKIDNKQEDKDIIIEKSLNYDDPFIIIKDYRTSRDTPLIASLKKQLDAKGSTGFTVKCSIILKFLISQEKYQNKYWKISELVQQLQSALLFLDQKQIPRRTIGRRLYQCLSIFRSIGVIQKVDKNYVYIKQSQQVPIAIQKRQHLSIRSQELTNKQNYLIGIQKQFEDYKKVRERNLIREKQLKEEIVSETSKFNPKAKYSFPLMIFYGKNPEQKIGVEFIKNEDQVQECLILTGSYEMLSALHACPLLKLDK